MKSMEDTEVFYKENMLPDLKKLEARRKLFLSRKQALFVFVVLSLGIHAGLILLKIKPIMSYTPVWSFFITAFLIPTIAFIIYHKFIADDDLLVDVSKLLIEKTMNFMLEDAHTEKESYIDYQDFKNSKIFIQKPMHYVGSGLTTGTLDGIKVVFSNIEMGASFAKDPKQGQTTWKSMFQGLFFIGEFGDQFKGTTLVIPDRLERIHGFLGAELKRNNLYRGQNVQFRKHPRFSECFAVYSDAPKEAQQILSEDLMNRFLGFTKRINADLYLSCTGKKIYVGLHLEGSELDFSYSNSITDYKHILGYYQELILVFEIIYSINERLVPKEESED